jgi:hypothetical protein
MPCHRIAVRPESFSTGPQMNPAISLKGVTSEAVSLKGATPPNDMVGAMIGYCPQMEVFAQRWRLGKGDESGASRQGRLLSNPSIEGMTGALGLLTKSLKWGRFEKCALCLTGFRVRDRHPEDNPLRNRERRAL